jgi:hypothetical protein
MNRVVNPQLFFFFSKPHFGSPNRRVQASFVSEKVQIKQGGGVWNGYNIWFRFGSINVARRA